MKKSIVAVFGVIMALMFMPFILAESEAPPEPDTEIAYNLDEPIKLINLSVAEDIPEEGIVRLKIQHRDIIESYLIDTKKELPKTLTYSALKPDNSYGIHLEAMEIRPPDDQRILHAYENNLPAKNGINHLVMKRIE